MTSVKLRICEEQISHAANHFIKRSPSIQARIIGLSLPPSITPLNLRPPHPSLLLLSCEKFHGHQTIPRCILLTRQFCMGTSLCVAFLHLGRWSPVLPSLLLTTLNCRVEQMPVQGSLRFSPKEKTEIPWMPHVLYVLSLDCILHHIYVFR